MEKLNFIIDFTNIKSAADVIIHFNEPFKFDLHGRSWDAFYDDITSLHTQSPVVIEKKPNAVHVILKNIHHFKENSLEEYRTLIELLAEATDKKQRYDGIDFSFEISNDIEK